MIIRYKPTVAPSPVAVAPIAQIHPLQQIAQQGLKSLDAFEEDKHRQDLIRKVSDFEDKARLIRETELAQQGENAYGSVQRGSDELEKIAQKEMEGIDPEFHSKFLAYAASTRNSLLNSLATHELAQHKVAMDNTVSTAVQSLKNNVYMDPSQLGRVLETSKDQLQTLGIPKGVGYYSKAKEELIKSALEGISDADPNAAQVYLAQNAKYFNDQDIHTAKKIILANQKRQVFLQKQALEQAQAKTQNDFIVGLDKLTPKEVRESNLPAVGAGSKEHFLDLIKKRDAPGKSAYDITQGATLAKILERENDPDQPPMMPKDILALVGHGLSAKDAQKLIKSTSLLNNPVFKSTEMALKAQFGYEGVLKGFGNKQAGALLYSKAMTDVMEMYNKGDFDDKDGNPMRGKALQKEIFGIAVPYLEYYMKNIVGNSPAEIQSRLADMGANPVAMANIINPKDNSIMFKDGKWQ